MEVCSTSLLLLENYKVTITAEAIKRRAGTIRWRDQQGTSELNVRIKAESGSTRRLIQVSFFFFNLVQGVEYLQLLDRHIGNNNGYMTCHGRSGGP